MPITKIAIIDVRVIVTGQGTFESDHEISAVQAWGKIYTTSGRVIPTSRIVRVVTGASA